MTTTPDDRELSSPVPAPARGPAAVTTTLAAPIGNQRWVNPLSGLNRQSVLVVLMAWMGFLLINLDTGLFTFLYPTIQQDLGISLNEIALLFTISTVIQTVVALLVGPLIDRFGRRTLFNLTMLGTSVGSVLTAFTAGIVSANVYRGITALGAAGEMDTSQTLVAEVVPAESRGWWNGFIQSGYPCGWLAAAGVSAVMLPTVGWRWAFVVGAAPALLIIVCRLWVKESPRFEALQKVRRGEELTSDSIINRIDRRKARRFEYSQLFQGDLRRTSIFVLLWQLIYNYGAAGIITYLPAIIVGDGYAQSDVFKAAAVAQVCGLVGYFVCSTLGNRYGRREISALFLVIGGFAGVLFLVVGTGTLTHIAAFYGLFYFFSIGQMGSAPGFVAEVFPTRVRGTGMALLVAAASGGFIIASATGPATLAAFGYSGALFLWCGLASFVAAAMALGARRIRPGLDLEAISV